MPPLPQYPGLPVGAPTINWGAMSTSPTWNVHGAQAGGDPRAPHLANLATAFDAAASNAQAEKARWDQYVKTIQDALQASAGFERTKLQKQYEDAEKGRQNAYKIADLQAQTSRYGVDRQTETELARLRENQRQFDNNHNLEMQKFGLDRERFGFEREKFGKEFGLEEQRFGLDKDRFGLDYANAYTNFAQTSDNPWLLKDFEGAVGRVGLGQGVQPISTQANQPRAKTWEDFAAISGYATLPGVQAGRTSTAEPAMAGSGPGAMAQEQSINNGPDKQLKAMRAVAEAMPPSATPGMDDSDWAAINAYKSLYFAGRPGEIARLGKERNKIGMNGLRRAGYNPALLEEDYTRGLPGQGSARAVA